MTSEIRSNKIKNRAGLGTITFSDTGAVLSGIVTASNDFRTNEIKSHSGLGTITVSNTGTVVAGILTATKFIGDGSGLTGNLSYSGNYLGMSDTPSSYTAGAFHRSNNAGNAMQNSATLFEDSNGDIGIGVNNPSSKLHVKQNSGDVHITVESAGNNKPFKVGVLGGASSGFFIKNGSTNNDIITSNSSDYVFLYGGGQQRIETTNTGVSISGVLDATGDVQISDKIIHTGDTNTAIRFPLNDTITFETGGTERYRIDSSGNSIFAGNISAVDGTFTGDVAVGGVLTYEDVTNIDSIGIITARSDIKVATAVTLTSAGAGFYAGIVTASDFVKRDGSSLGGFSPDAQGNLVAGTNAGSSFSGVNAEHNLILGNDAGNDITSGDKNILLGKSSGDALTSAYENVYIGYEAGFSSSGNRNIGIGYRAGDNDSGNYSISLGYSAGNRVTGSNNICVGELAGGGSGNFNSGIKNIFIGDYIQTYPSTSQSNNVVIGHDAYKGHSNDLASGSNNIILGFEANPSANNVSNEITLGNSNITNFRIPGIGVTFATSGNHITGITTFSDKIKFGSSGESEIRYHGGVLKIHSTSSNSQIELESDKNFNFKYVTSGGFHFTGAGQQILSMYGGSGGGIYFRHNNSQKLKLEGGNFTYENSPTVTFDGNILASSDGAIDIGTNSVRFRNIYADNIYGDGTNITGISGGGGVSSDSQENTVGGTNAGNALTSNSVSNTLFGAESGRLVDTGDRNTAIGRYTLNTATSSSDNVAIGYNSLYATIANNNTAIGSYAGRNISSGTDNTILGKSAADQLTTSSYNVIVGSDAGKGANQSTASRNVIIGYQAIQNQDNPSDQVAIGYRAMANQKDDASGNVAVGSYALECATNQEVYNNTCIGMNAGRTAESGFGQSVFVGYSAGEYVNGPDYCTGIGYLSMRGNSGNKLTGYHNTASGYRSLALVQGAGEKNTALGSEAGDTITTGKNNICIGYNTQASSATVENEITIGDSNITKFRIPGLSASISSTESVLPAANFNAGVLQEAYYYDTGSGIQGNYSHDILTYGMVFNQASNAAGSFTFNIRGNSSTTFDSLTTTNRVTTMTIYSANNSTSNYMTAFKIDGTTQTVKWAGGSAPSAATGSGVDVYSMTIMKTGSNTYQVFGNFTNFA